MSVTMAYSAALTGKACFMSQSFSHEVDLDFYGHERLALSYGSVSSNS